MAEETNESDELIVEEGNEENEQEAVEYGFLGLSNKLLTIIVIVLFLIMAGLGGAYFFLQDNPTPTTDSEETEAPTTDTNTEKEPNTTGENKPVVTGTDEPSTNTEQTNTEAKATPAPPSSEPTMPNPANETAEAKQDQVTPSPASNTGDELKQTDVDDNAPSEGDSKKELVLEILRLQKEQADLRAQKQELIKKVESLLKENGSANTSFARKNTVEKHYNQDMLNQLVEPSDAGIQNSTQTQQYRYQEPNNSSDVLDPMWGIDTPYKQQ